MKFILSNKGVLFYLLAMLTTVLLNIFVKSAIVKFKLPTTEVLCLRQAIIVVCLLPVMIKLKFNFFDKTSLKPNLIRNILFSFSTLLLYLGMSKVPLNDATAITFLTPIIGSFLAVTLLKEKTSKTIWIALLLAVIGVLVVKKPSFQDKDFILGYGPLFLCVIIRGYIVILNKRLAGKFSTMTLLFYTHIIMLLFSLCFVKQFIAVPVEALKYIVGAAFLFFVEYFLIFKAYKISNASTLQPLEFSRLIFMMILSSLLLDENITTNQVIGGSIIIGGYLVMIFAKKKNK